MFLIFLIHLLIYTSIDKIGKEEAEQAYANTILPALSFRPDLFISPSENYTMSQYHIAGSRILSRSFMVEKWGPEPSDDEDDEGDEEENEDEEETDEDVSMVPMADMLNARCGCNNV